MPNSELIKIPIRKENRIKKNNNYKNYFNLNQYQVL
jgi:hypothetical protein